MRHPKVRYNAQKIVVARMRKGWTQTHLAFLVGLSQTHLNRIERGKSSNPATVARICRALGLKIADLVEEDPVEKPA